MAARSSATNIEDYIAEFPMETQTVLQELRSFIRECAPGAVETMSYAIPTFDLNGQHVVHFAGYDKHVGFYPTGKGVEAFKHEFGPYKWSAGTVQFPLGDPLPKDLIRRIVEYRVQQCSEKKKR